MIGEAPVRLVTWRPLPLVHEANVSETKATLAPNSGQVSNDYDFMNAPSPGPEVSVFSAQSCLNRCN